MTPNQHHEVDIGLRRRLAAVLPDGYEFGVHHISTPPTKTDPLYSPPPNERPERTYCENHFLAISIDAPEASLSSSFSSDIDQSKNQVLVLGVEVFIYTSVRSTTLFVSKADSTGYLDLLKLPKGTSSPIREICTAFVGYLLEKRKRKGTQFIINLFARAQDQYLFPGSVDYSGKHVLDDRGLIKWWCRVLDPILASKSKETHPSWQSSKGYLIVPGLDSYETKTFIPRNAAPSSWTLAHPLERISHYYREFDWVPPRCLIPHFPDDPKSRFRDELDEEAGGAKGMKKTGSWKSVKTLDTFWELMAFRQECSSGRMTGFIWVVFDDEVEDKSASESAQSQTLSAPETPKKQRTVNITPNSTPRKLFPTKDDLSRQEREKTKKKQCKKKTLKGPITPRAPRIKKEQRNYLLDRPTSTAHYSWPLEGRGEKIVSETTYKRIVGVLLHMDFSNLNKAAGSTRRWLSEVGMGSKWGATITGTRELPALNQNDTASGAQVNNLSGLVKRKRTDTTSQKAEELEPKVNVLSAGLVRRKSKEENGTTSNGETKEPAVNVLPAGLVRKKPKE
ncbi:histone acetylation protein-domain-containing protein [Thelonectria olida]|uniref:histone acetyltransferase n=1 Tax=Thelonectria olida TaxID=1576542 RepID=A0A9P8W8Y2_9HYPO|nr:histone acetylation protein-domain-containing protein [Thelonectria olida]